jgi:membrane protease YdiL (CAAX protease family)
MPETVGSEVPVVVRLRPEPIAPWPHTVFLMVVLGLGAAYGALRLRVPAAMGPRAFTYGSSIVLQCLLVGTTIAGLYHRRRFLVGVVGEPATWRVLPDVATGLGVYLAGCATMLVMGLATWPLHLARPSGVVQALAPHTRAELALWLLVSLSAGVGEEFVFRGYLLRQFTRWSGSTAVGIGASAVLFGCMHFYEGTAAVVVITGLGALFAVVAVWRGNLRTVMVAHFLQDALTGLFLYLHR